ncbi:MAG: NADH-quinone oxidoreductase subunit L [Reinekea sp.]|nr:NADH-quinone oxidoreductase subunit L [Reinekea sp.]
MMVWLTSMLFLLIPLSLAAGGVYAGRRPGVNPGTAMVRLTLVLLVVYLLAMISVAFLPQPDPSASVLSLSILNRVMIGLVVFMTVILAAYSRQYMAGETRVGFYWRWLLFTTSAVALVVMSNHLLLFWLGWLGISLALHKLLTFYPDRPRAVLAAHKKFLLARTAETLLLVAFVLLYHQHQTGLISELMAHFSRVAANETLSLTMTDRIAAVLIAITALIKCAQLPIHGWLMQVVEAPTPISALLHAGVINLGGFLLILFAPLFSQVAFAQWTVLIIAGLTTLLSALIMSTRISVKVRLAWSTSAQMGLMLLEVALGLYELALLHLLTHSAYKAHAFLNAGHAVYDDMVRRLSPARSPSALDWMVAALVSGAAVALVIIGLDYHGPLSSWVLLALALTMLVAQRQSLLVRAKVLPMAGLALVLAVTYGALKASSGALLPPYGLSPEAMFSAPDIWALVLFGCLFFISWLLRYRADKPLMQRLSMVLFAGLYLDEWLTRATIKIWPVRMPPREHAKKLKLTQLQRAEEC